MHVRRAAALAAAALLGTGAAAALVPQAQAGHCSGMLMFSGHSAHGQRLNPGVGGCLFVGHEDENVNTNYFVPGADMVSVGSPADPEAWVDSDADGTRNEVVTAGTITVTYHDPVAGEVTVTEDLTWTWNGTTRWNSQALTFPGPLVEATAELLTQPNIVVTNTYRAVTEG